MRGTFALLERTGAPARLVGTLVGRTRRPKTVVVLVSPVFATLGGLENMHEAIVGFVGIFPAR